LSVIVEDLNSISSQAADRLFGDAMNFVYQKLELDKAVTFARDSYQGALRELEDARRKVCPSITSYCSRTETTCSGICNSIGLGPLCGGCTVFSCELDHHFVYTRKSYLHFFPFFLFFSFCFFFFKTLTARARLDASIWKAF
jgi:hypothetical protein